MDEKVVSDSYESNNMAVSRPNVDTAALKAFDQARSFFSDVTYLKEHPAPNITVAELEKKLVDWCVEHVVPTGKRIIDGQEISYGSWFNAETENWFQNSSSDTFAIEGSEPVKIESLGENSWTGLRSDKPPASLNISQGSINNPKRHEGYFFSHASLSSMDNIMSQFNKGWGMHIVDYLNNHNVQRRLFPALKTFGDLVIENGGVKGVVYPPQYSGNILGMDVRSILPDGTRGTLRGGFVQELTMRYFDAIADIRGIPRIPYIFDILTGEDKNNMADIYHAFQKAKLSLKETNPDIDQETLLIEAAKAVRPYAKWGFEEFQVIELPPEVSPLVLISAHRT